MERNKRSSENVNVEELELLWEGVWSSLLAFSEFRNSSFHAIFYNWNAAVIWNF